MDVNAQTFDLDTAPQSITPDDVGRAVAAIQSIDWDWIIPASMGLTGLVEDVQPSYCPAATMVRVSVAGRDLGWYASHSVRLVQ